MGRCTSTSAARSTASRRTQRSTTFPRCASARSARGRTPSSERPLQHFAGRHFWDYRLFQRGERFCKSFAQSLLLETHLFCCSPRLLPTFAFFGNVFSRTGLFPVHSG